MISEQEKLLLWTEVYNGVPRGQDPVAWGWCVFPKNYDLHAARDRAVSQFCHPGGRIVMTYTTDRCAMKFRASDPILGIFG